MTDYERGLYQAKIADLEKQLEGGVPVQHSHSETRGGGPASGDDIVVRMKEWIRLPVYGTARDIMARGAREIETLRALLANRWMVDERGNSQPRQNHRRPDQR